MIKYREIPVLIGQGLAQQVVVLAVAVKDADGDAGRGSALNVRDGAEDGPFIGFGGRPAACAGGLRGSLFADL